MVFNSQDGRIACNHIEYWEEDLQLVSDAGFGAYRFSFSWPRLMPDGNQSLNQKGISFYDKLIDKMLELDLKPFGTFYHWDLPIYLADLGRWPSDSPGYKIAGSVSRNSSTEIQRSILLITLK